MPNSLIRLPQQTLQTNQHGPNIQHRTPFILQDIQTDPPLEIDVGVVNGCPELDLGRHEGISGRELKGELQCEARVGSVCGTGHGGVPVEHVAVVGEGGAVWWRGGHEGH